jgi:aspartyl-tRNA(Asn)/glutamyl-tRNA(Gln) amidotransferase subunit A
MALSWTMDKLGPLGRTAEDCGLVLEAIAGVDPLDPTTLQQFTVSLSPPSDNGVFLPVPFPQLASKHFRLGILRGTREKTQPEVLANFETSLGVLRKVADITEDVVLPDFPFDAAAGIIIDAEAASAFESLFESGRITRLTAPEDRLGGYPGQVLLAKDYLRALRIRRPASVALDRLLSGFDAIVAPSLPTVAWPLDTAFDKVYPRFPGGTNISGPANLAGVPGLFLMNGVGERGLPTSLQLTGRAGSEATLLAIGMRYQESTGFHRMRPPGL